MSNALATSENKLWTTPLRDLLRGRITGRLNWQARLAAAELPVEVRQMILRIVKQTSLWRLERAAVADDLMSQARGDLASGHSLADLLERFGDERAVAKQIRLARRQPKWRSRLAASSLPADAAAVVVRIVNRTRLWRWEKGAVADELAGHFQDGLTAGSTAAELIERFGDERAAAKLIRRGKKRNRPLIWHAWIFCTRAVAALLLIYSAFFFRFWIGKPTISVNYMAKLNEPIRATPESDRAWSIYRNAILSVAEPDATGTPYFPAIVYEDSATLEAKLAWIDQHQPFLQMLKEAARKPKLGFVLGPVGSQNDPVLFRTWYGLQEPGRNMELMAILLPHAGYLREIKNILSLDLRRAKDISDGPCIDADLIAMLGVARQLRENDGLVVTQLAGLGIQSETVAALQRVIENEPALLTDQQLSDLAHQIAGPELAADLINPRNDRYFLDDLIQRFYTDDGHGDGRMTAEGAKQIALLIPRKTDEKDDSRTSLLPLEQALPLAAAWRAELVEKFKQWMNEMVENFHRPIRDVDWTPLESQRKELADSLVETSRYALLAFEFPDVSRCQITCERYLGSRDGTLVAIGLEIYHRRNGHYPATLAELVPRLLPAIPADRITGDPVKYKLIDGKPVVYSVGGDRVDDGGTRASTAPRGARRIDVASWGVKPAEVFRGDWILYPPDKEE